MAALPFHVRPSESLYFKEGGTWSAISSGKFSIRYYPKGFLFDAGGQIAVGKNVKNLIGYLNSNLFDVIAKLTMPTINYKCGVVKTLPNFSIENKELLIDKNISISKQDWDAHETSWDFLRNELLTIDEATYADNIQYQIEKHEKETGEKICIDPAAPELGSLAWRIEQYKLKWEKLFMQLHANEEELNRQFIDIYGLQDELTPDVPLDEVTILQQGEISIE